MKINKEKINCKICNSQNLRVYMEHPAIMYCNNCKNAFRVGKSLQIDELYLKGISMPNYFEATIRNRHHYDFIESSIGFDKIENILEIGSGNGSFLRFIRNRHKNIKITAVEPGINFGKELNRIENVTVINEFIEKAKIEERFDLVIMSHILEHIEEPQQTINFIYKNILKSTGSLYIDVPNKDYELRNVSGAMRAPQIHLFFFGGDGIKNVLKNAGFDEKHIFGNKYSTLPLDFILRSEKISNLNSTKRFKLAQLKIFNLISLQFSDFIKLFFKMRPKTIALEATDFRYNNMAVIAKMK